MKKLLVCFLLVATSSCYAITDNAVATGNAVETPARPIVYIGDDTMAINMELFDIEVLDKVLILKLRK